MPLYDLALKVTQCLFCNMPFIVDAAQPCSVWEVAVQKLNARRPLVHYIFFCLINVFSNFSLIKLFKYFNKHTDNAVNISVHILPKYGSFCRLTHHEQSQQIGAFRFTSLCQVFCESSCKMFYPLLPSPLRSDVPIDPTQGLS